MQTEIKTKEKIMFFKSYCDMRLELCSRNALIKKANDNYAKLLAGSAVKEIDYQAEILLLKDDAEILKADHAKRLLGMEEHYRIEIKRLQKCIKRFKDRLYVLEAKK